MRVTGLVLAVLLVTSGLAGCIGGENADPVDAEPANATNATAPLDLAPPEVRNDALHVDVDMPVVTVGFSEEDAADLDGRLDGETVHHWHGGQVPALDAESRLERGEWDTAPMPIQARAVYHVEPAPQPVEDELADRLEAMDEPGDANAVESLLADELRENGIELDGNRPLIVLLDASAFEDAPDTWKYTLPNGHLDDVDVFGEREPLLVANVGSGSVAASEELVRRATHHRLLQGSLYPISTASCHAVTLITAYRPSSQAEHNPQMEDALELFEPDRIERALENLTSDEVHVDAKVLELPVDDPALGALTRTESYSWPTHRDWIVENWGDYWVEREGCAGYVSLVVHSDAASAPSVSPGTSTYDAETGRRVALGWVNDVVRLAADPDGPSQVLTDPESYLEFEWINHLHAHEVGHLFGLRHPRGVQSGETTGAMNWTFSETRTAMAEAPNRFPGPDAASYNLGRVIDFSTLDSANYERNKAGFVIVAAHEQGLADTPAFDQALAHAADYEWAKASEALEPLLKDSGDGGVS